jgi:hypothetical protein
VLDLTHGKVEESHVVLDLKRALRTSHTYEKRQPIQTERSDATGLTHTHRCTETTIDLENGQLAESGGVLGFRKCVVRHDLVISRGLDEVPVPVYMYARVSDNAYAITERG